MHMTFSPHLHKGIAALSIILAVLLIVVCPGSAFADDASTADSTTLAAGQQESTDMTAATQVSVSQTGLTIRANVQNRGWLKAVAAKKIAGTKTKKSLRAFKISVVNPAGLSGHIKYRTYDWGKGWGKTAMDGKSSGRSTRAVRGVKIWLTGKLSKCFDVKYRTYIKGRGWLPWVQNKAAAGSTKGNWYVSAIQVKLVSKVDDSNAQTLNGIDIASWQEGLNPTKVDADFIIVKSTEGTWYTNPYFRKWADATLACGKLLGTYHFASKGNAIKQADYFVDTVGDYVGKCALFLDWEADALSQGPAWAKKFMDRVYARTGVKPLIYMSKSVCKIYDWKEVAPQYGLWVAQYAYKYQNNGTGYLTNPWTDDSGYGAWSSPTIYQYTSMGRISGYSKNLDLNLFYGTAEDWKKLEKKS